LIRPSLTTVAVVIATALIAPTMQGCGPAIVVGASYGASVMYDRRDDRTVFDDEVIEFQARDAYLKNPDISKHSQLKVTSYNYTALITGQVETAELSDRFAHVVSQLPKVKQVYNEAEIGPMISVKQLTTDAYLTSRAKLAIQSVDLPGFDALRVKIVTENGVVYLMGLVTEQEGDATAEKVRRIPGVTRVVKIFEYIQLQSPPNSQADPP